MNRRDRRDFGDVYDKIYTGGCKYKIDSDEPFDIKYNFGAEDKFWLLTEEFKHFVLYEAVNIDVDVYNLRNGRWLKASCNLAEWLYINQFFQTDLFSYRDIETSYANESVRKSNERAIIKYYVLKDQDYFKDDLLGEFEIYVVNRYE